MTLDEYADFEQRCGEKLVNADGYWWRIIKRIFHRPIYPFHTLEPGHTIPKGFYLGGFQYPERDGDRANSLMKYYLFDDVKSYDIRSLGYNTRREIGIAEKHLEIRVSGKGSTFLEDGYETYLSFFHRTKYGTNKARREREKYDRWAKLLMSERDIHLMGAFHKGGLVGYIGMAHVRSHMDWLFSIGHSDFMKYHVSDLLLHHMRMHIARMDEDVDFIYAGMHSDSPGVNRFKEGRGAKLVETPAYYYLNPILSHGMKWVDRRMFSRLEGKDG